MMEISMMLTAKKNVVNQTEKRPECLCKSKLRNASATASANKVFCISITILRMKSPP